MRVPRGGAPQPRPRAPRRRRTRADAAAAQASESLARVAALEAELTEARNAPAALAAAEAALAAKQKEIDLTKSEILNYERSMREAQSEAKQIHAFLDAVPNPPASKALDGYTTINAMTRLSVWLATRGQGKG